MLEARKTPLSDSTTACSDSTTISLRAEALCVQKWRHDKPLGCPSCTAQLVPRPLTRQAHLPVRAADALAVPLQVAHEEAGAHL